FDDVANRLLRGAPPIGGVLFGPRRARRCKRRMLRGAGSKDSAVFRYEDGARSAGAYVNAKDRNSLSPLPVRLLLHGALQRKRVEVFARRDEDVLASIEHISNGRIARVGEQRGVPQRFAGLRVPCDEVV